ncbi:MAG: hypothetical protein ACK4UN_13020 [Limisphaerales bacterium]
MRFRIAIWPLAMWTWVFGMVGFLFFVAFDFSSGIYWPGVGLGMIGGSLIAFAGSIVIVWFCPHHISAEGLQGYSVWGTRRFIRWEGVDCVKRLRLGNLVWLRLFSRENGKVIWLPLFIYDREAFCACLEKYSVAESIKRHFSR